MLLITREDIRQKDIRRVREKLDERIEKNYPHKKGCKVYKQVWEEYKEVLKGEIEGDIREYIKTKVKKEEEIKENQEMYEKYLGEVVIVVFLLLLETEGYIIRQNTEGDGVEDITIEIEKL